jgi:hypothetical protein
MKKLITLTLIFLVLTACESKPFTGYIVAKEYVEVKSPENKELIYDWGTNNTNEEAELACLEKLIEILENK